MLIVDFKMVIGSFNAIETINGQKYVNKYHICKANCLGAIILKKQNGNDANNTLVYFLADNKHLKNIIASHDIDRPIFGRIEEPIKLNMHFKECQQWQKFFLHQGYQVLTYTSRTNP